MGLFSGTTEYYAKYRMGYAPEYYRKIFSECGINKDSTVMDLACGPGIVALEIAPLVKKVIAVDIEKEFIEKGRELAAERGIDNIEWHLLPAEEIASLDKQVDMIICSHAFHWLKREEVAAQAYNMLPSGGAVVLASDTTAPYWTTDEVKDLVNKLTAGYLDTVIKTRKCDSSRTHELVLQKAGFNVGSFIVDCGKRRTTPERVLGWYLSTSFANPEVLGNNLENFKTRVLALLNSMPKEKFVEEVKAKAIIARKA